LQTGRRSNEIGANARQIYGIGEFTVEMGSPTSFAGLIFRPSAATFAQRQHGIGPLAPDNACCANYVFS